MAKDRFDEILARLKKIETMVEKVQGTQDYHTQRFDDIDKQLKYITREIRVPILNAIREIQKRLGLEKLDPVKEQAKVKL